MGEEVDVRQIRGGVFVKIYVQKRRRQKRMRNVYNNVATVPKTPATTTATPAEKLRVVAPLALPDVPELELPVAEAPLDEADFEPEGLAVLLSDEEPDDVEPAGTAAARLAMLCQVALELVDASPCL